MYVEEEDGQPQPSLRAVGESLGRWAMRPLRYAADLVLPPICLNCHEPVADHCKLCARCWLRIDFISAPLCQRLGTPLPYATEEAPLSSAALRREPDFG